MNAVLTLTRSTIGKKVVMAVTGAIMAGWLFLHMAGNLQVFLGWEAFNHYAALIQGQKELLWAMRLALLTALILHVWAIVSLVQTSAAARATGYAAGRQSRASTLASRSMRYGGVILVVYLIFHILDLTVGLPAANPAFQHGEAYNNLVYSLRRPAVAAFYLVAMGALGLHLRHGVASLFQTLGLNPIGGRATADQVATAFAALVVGGNVLIVLAILTGMVQVNP